MYTFNHSNGLARVSGSVGFLNGVPFKFEHQIYHHEKLTKGILACVQTSPISFASRGTKGNRRRLRGQASFV